VCYFILKQIEKGELDMCRLTNAVAGEEDDNKTKCFILMEV